MKSLFASHTRSAFLKPGDVILAYEPMLISSVLGSCVAVTMFSPSRRIGAICHAMLPYSGGRDHDMRYVDTALLHIYRKISEAGAADLVVKLFGGAQVLDFNCYEAGKGTVGEQNVAQAEKVLVALGLKIAARDTGGVQGRKLYFCTRNGDVFLHRMVQRSQTDYPEVVSWAKSR